MKSLSPCVRMAECSKGVGRNKSITVCVSSNLTPDIIFNGIFESLEETSHLLNQSKKQSKHVSDTFFYIVIWNFMVLSTRKLKNKIIQIQHASLTHMQKCAKNDE